MTSPSSAPGAALEAHLRAAVASYGAGSESSRPSDPERRARLWQLFEAGACSRHLDVVARELQARGEGFYTIGSAGHESNAGVALALRPTDPALLHYRSGGFYAARASQVAGSTPIRDVLQGLMGMADEPIAGGRHKVFGRRELDIVPQTSTIASHLPRAVGLAIALRRATRLGRRTDWPEDAIVVCSFGDASANHSTATGAINTALNTAHRGLPVPVLLVCEDNGVGISVPTPPDWIATGYSNRPGLHYLAADGSDPDQVEAAATAAVDHVRTTARPAFLHLRTVRFLAHAGSDAEISYRTPRQIEADYERDPLLGCARALIADGVDAEQVLKRYDQLRADVDTEADALRGHRRLSSAEEVIAPLAPHSPSRVAEVAARLGDPREDHRRDRGRSRATLAESINRALAGILTHDPGALVFGEDVGVKGGVYGVTGGLTRRFGAARVFDTLLDEQSILGLGLGAGLAGLLPIPEIQYLAYLHNAIDQLRGEAASLSFFSTGRYRNPMVVRVAGLAYQKGFGGHFHNDNALASLRDIPGLVVGVPARGDDAAGMLRSCVAAGRVDGTVSVLVEPIALYHRRDLHRPGDDGWLSVDDGAAVPIGSARCHLDGTDLTMITFGNGVPMSLRVARRLSEAGIEARVLDLRWISPLPVADLLEAARSTGRVLVVDETRHSGGVGEGVIAALVENGFDGLVRRVASVDSFVPLGRAAEHVLLGETEIDKAARELTEARGPRERDR